MGIAERQWSLIPAADPEKASQLAAELGIDRVLADLLVQQYPYSYTPYAQ